MKYIKQTLLGRTVLSVAIAIIGMFVMTYANAEEPVSAGSEAETIDVAVDEVKRLTRPDSELEVGVGHVSEDSYKFGNFTGLQESGAYLIGNLQVIKREQGGTHYLEVIGRNLGLDNAQELQIKGGEQGNYGFSFEYDELPRLYSDRYQSPYAGMGSTRLIKPAGWDGTIDTTPSGAIDAPVAATVITTPMMTALAANMKQFNIDTKRQTMGLSVSKQLSEGLEVYTSFKRDEKNGTRLTGAPLQIGGGGSRGTLLVPEPIDYTTDIIDTAVRYTDEKWQAQVGYYASLGLVSCISVSVTIF